MCPIATRTSGLFYKTFYGRTLPLGQAPALPANFRLTVTNALAYYSAELTKAPGLNFIKLSEGIFSLLALSSFALVQFMWVRAAH